MKHIESILPENVAAELARLLSDDATISLTLKDLLHRDTGCDIPSLDNIPSSDIEEVIPLCLSILRRFWNTPLTALGDGTNKKSLADTFKRLINNRVQGNEALSIPAIHANIPTAVSQLLARKISGMPEAPDGLSFVRILCDSTLSFTELLDDNRGWVMDKEGCVQRAAAMFPNITMHFGCKSVTAHIVRQDITGSAVLYFDKCTSIPTRFVGESSNNTTSGAPNYEVHMKALETTNQTENTYSSFYCGKVYLPAYKYGVLRMGGSASYSNMWMNYLYLGCKGNKDQIIRVWNHDSNGTIKDIEIGEGACQNLTLQNCDGLTSENMYNHILCRLKQDEPMCGEGVTITLGTTNLDKLEAVEEYNLKLTELTDTYGYTFA
jgi:hypothetical protein